MSEEDDWGYDAAYVRALSPVTSFMYERWWRVDAAGLERVPADGPALVLANHDGALPYDALMIATALRRGPRPRDARFLARAGAFELPVASPALRRFGGAPESAQNAAALLAEGHVVIGFSGRGPQPYRVGRFGQGELIAAALRAGAPIVPCAVVGGEEVHPLLATATLLGAQARRAAVRAAAAAVEVADHVLRAARVRRAARGGGRPRARALAFRPRPRDDPGVGPRDPDPSKGSVRLMSDPQFASADEFRAAVEWIYRTMSADPEIGPRYHEAGVSQRFEFPDLGLVFHVRPGEREHVEWAWGEVEWEPQVRLAMDSGTANRYWQGKENVAMAIARRRIKPGGDVKAALALIPVTRPMHDRYRGYLADELPHLLA